MTGRSVARPVVNLGNTCYMNAVLQALAHAPELCLAMDCEPHSSVCPRKNRRSPSASPENTKPTRKSSRRRRKSPADTDSSSSETDFCVLCEVEDHMRQVHDPDRDTPVAPSAFVNGFTEHVAPWFEAGMQQDSHEFLRLLIDAMQKSSRKARRTSTENEDREYPFSLFCGTVESNVVCSSCSAVSSTLDPIEDIGLEVTKEQAVAAPLRPTRSSSRNASPLPTVPNTLWDVQTAFQRFARTETLDAGYKCEKCGKVGRATKQSMLAAIPPILTLHLKRFRYGGFAAPKAASVATPTMATRRSGRTSEVSQLLGGSDYMIGRSGSAKIEGHVKFDMFFDLQPYLTDELKKLHKNMYCRLFAVIVHAGTNSHSGHYISYVRNVAKNEWWKMDDSRVSFATEAEVMNAEAYMLFYRVVGHPVAAELESQKKSNFVPATPPPPKPSPTSSTNGSKKRSAVYESSEDWARKVNFPPNLRSVISKLSKVIEDDITNTEIDELKYKTAIRELLYKLRSDTENVRVTLEELEKPTTGLL